MYKNALKEDLIRVVEDLDGTVESTDTIAKLKTKIENSSTFESETYIQFAARLTANFQYYCSLRKVNSFESLCDLIISDKLFETLNKETATYVGIREAEDWFRPIDLAKECDIYISSRSGSHKEIPITYGYTQDPFKNRSQNFNPNIKENYPQYLERENKNCFICGDSSHYARDCEKRFKPKESNDHIHNRINVNTLKIESEKQNCVEFANLQYVSIFVENQPVTALIDSGCQIPVLNSSLIRVQTPSEEIITLSSCFGEQRMVEVKPINISLNQLSSGLSVQTAISPTLTEEFIIHTSVYAEIKKLGHAKSDVLLSESGSSLGVHFNSNVSVSILCKKVNGAMKTSSVEFISRSPTPLPMKSKHRRFSSGLDEKGKKGRTAAYSVQSGWPIVAAKAKQSSRAGNTPTQIKDELDSVYGDSVPSFTTVKFWTAEFKRGRNSLGDDERSGRPSTATTDENITEVHQMVLDDRRIKRLLRLDQKRVRMNISNDLLEQFRLNKPEFWRRLIIVEETWIHHYTLGTKIQFKQWTAKGEPSPKKAKTVFPAGKVMATVFRDSHGVILIDYLQKGKTITGPYNASLHDKLKAELVGKRSHLQKKENLLHQHNVPSHTSAVAMVKIHELRIELLDHPPYSPDLAPSNFFLFPYLKIALGGQRISSNEETITFVDNYLAEKNAGYYLDGLQRWEHIVGRSV
ncbi:histone-lysine N-methyltransferase SETMAR [Trichonephila clavipes]|nr:histone-lysine N-methyltransferase SETMAR [Trichonephila clavipes]